MPLIENRPLAGYPLRVETALTGRFERARLSVADTVTEPGASRRVFLTPPEIVVRLQLVAARPTEYAFAVTINGRTVRERGCVGAGKLRVEHVYPFSAFGLDPAIPPHDDPAAPRRVRPERERIGRIPMPVGFHARTARPA